MTVAKLKRVMTHGGDFYGLRFDCPGCGRMHLLPTDETPAHVTKADRWKFNGDYRRPVLSPSVLNRQEMHEPPVTAENLEEWKRNPWPQAKVMRVCHSFIGCNGAQPGQITFLSDCTHALAGQTVDLPEIEEEESDG